MLRRLGVAVSSFMSGMESMCKGMDDVAEVLFQGISGSKTLNQFHSVVDVGYVRSQVVRYRETTQSLTNVQAPQSAYARLKRDLGYNIATPLRDFLNWSVSLRSQLAYRRRLMAEYQLSLKGVDSVMRRIKDESDVRFASARDLLVEMTQSYGPIDRRCYVWLTVLEDFRIDIWDTITQTLKHLQYEFFKSATNAWQRALPTEIEFRPLVEMVPSIVETVVDDEERTLHKRELADVKASVIGMALESVPETELVPFVTKGSTPSDCVVGATKRRIASGCCLPTSGPNHNAKENPGPRPDPVNVSLLEAQGIRRSEAEAALRATNNDFQAAMDYILCGGEPEGLQCPHEPEETITVFNDVDTIHSVRKPSSLKWVERHRAIQKRYSKRRDASQQALDTEGLFAISNDPMKGTNGKESNVPTVGSILEDLETKKGCSIHQSSDLNASPSQTRDGHDDVEDRDQDQSSSNNGAISAPSVAELPGKEAIASVGVYSSRSNKKPVLMTADGGWNTVLANHQDDYSENSWFEEN